jgi:hypothetical protein
MKSNKDGRPCPDWCTVDHSTGRLSGCLGSAPMIHGPDEVTFRALPRLGPWADSAEVIVDAWDDHRSPHVGVTTRKDAELVASMLEIISAAGPEAGRALAGQVRQAADVAWPQAGAEADPEAGA